MDLYLMRHGDAVAPGDSMDGDGSRPLSVSGQAQVRRVAEGLKRRGTVLDAVVSSPLKRARETAELIAHGLQVPRVETSETLSPSRSPVGLRGLLERYPESRGLLLVGHHPDVTLWTAFLANLDPSACPIFTTAAISAIRLDGKTAEFLWFQTPDQLARNA